MSSKCPRFLRAAARAATESVPRALVLIGLVVALLFGISPDPPASAIAATVPLVLLHPYDSQRKVGALVGLTGTLVLTTSKLADDVGGEFMLIVLALAIYSFRRSRQPPAPPPSSRDQLPKPPRGTHFLDAWHRRHALTLGELLHRHVLPLLAGAAAPLHIAPAYASVRNLVVAHLTKSLPARWEEVSRSLGVLLHGSGELLLCVADRSRNVVLNAVLHDPSLTAFITFVALVLCWLLWPARAAAFSDGLMRATFCLGCAIYSIGVLASMLLRNASDLLTIWPNAKTMLEKAAIAAVVGQEQAAGLAVGMTIQGVMANPTFIQGVSTAAGLLADRFLGPRQAVPAIV